MTDVAVRIVSLDESDTFELRNPAGGLFVESLTLPEEATREVRITAPRVDGSFLIATADEDGFVGVGMRVEGSSWAQCTSRWQAVRTAYRADDEFYLETEIEGVTTRYFAERPAVSPAGLDGSTVATLRQWYQLRFRVQPNPSVTID